MTIEQARSAADGLRNNLIDRDVKKRMLSELDGRIYYEIMNAYGKEGEFEGYSPTTPNDRELLVPYPYDSLYIAYLEQELERLSGELQRYNNASVLFNERYGAFSAWWMRTHTSDTPKLKFPTRR